MAGNVDSNSLYLKRYAVTCIFDTAVTIILLYQRFFSFEFKETAAKMVKNINYLKFIVFVSHNP